MKGCLRSQSSHIQSFVILPNFIYEEQLEIGQLGPIRLLHPQNTFNTMLKMCLLLPHILSAQNVSLFCLITQLIE